MKRKLLLLLIVFVLLIPLAFLIKRLARKSLEKELLSGFKQQEITGIDMKRRDDRLSLVKEGELWKMKEPLETEADKKIVDGFIKQMKELALGPVISTQSGKLGKFEVDDNDGIHFRMSAEGNREIAVVFGKSTADYTGVYLRFPEENKVYLSRGLRRHFLTRKWQDWAEKQITSFDPGDIAGFVLKKSGSSIEFTKTEDRWFRGGKEADGSEIDKLVQILKDFRAVDFLKPEERQGLDSVLSLTLRLKDREQTIHLYRKKEFYYVQDEGKDVFRMIRKDQGQAFERFKT